MVTQVGGGRHPRQSHPECVWTVLLAMEGEDEGVATAAIDSSKFFDVIVWEVVFPMIWWRWESQTVCGSSKPASSSN